jgi:pimeloyl-ACP methyl ester carboxylesterase
LRRWSWRSCSPPARAGDASGDGAGPIPSLVAGNHHRFCGYDRANTGNSDKVPGPLDGETTVADMHRLLKAAHIDPPYVLLGASFGGLAAYMYAVTYPKEVVGMVLPARLRGGRPRPYRQGAGAGDRQPLGLGAPVADGHGCG